MIKLPDWLLRLLGLLGPKPTPIPAPAPVPVPVPSPTPTPTSASLFNAINAARRANGLAILAYDAGLDQIANYWAESVAMNDTLTHGDFPSRLFSVHPNHAGGETIAEGYLGAVQTVDGWMGHPPHRVIILGDWKSCGCGWAVDARGTSFAVADFDN